MSKTKSDTIRDKVTKAIAETRKNLYEREELAKLIWATIGADLNLIMLGDPGTAKTMMAVNLTQTIKDAKIFRYTLNSFTTVDEIFGHFDLVELKTNNKLRRQITNKLLDCNVAYLDEFFKSNSGTLNALLDVLNEKQFTDSYGTYDVPLKFLISSSNELPAEEDNLAAVLDRFQVKFLVKSIQDHSVRIGAYNSLGNSLEEIKPVISLEEIDSYRKLVPAIEYTKEVAEMTESIYQAIVKENIYVSDRTVFRTINLVKANAFLRGAETVAAEDLVILKDAFWTEMSEMKTIKKIIFDIANPTAGKIEDEWEAIQETIEIKEKAIKKEKDSTVVASTTFELVKKIRSARSKIDDYAKILERMDCDASDARTKISNLDQKIKSVIDTGHLLDD